MSLLFDLTWRGSLVGLFTWLLSELFRRFLGNQSRRIWWCLVPLAFLVTARWPLPLLLQSSFSASSLIHQSSLFQSLLPLGAEATISQPVTLSSLLYLGWATGALTFILMVLTQTYRALRLWSQERLSTDSRLLELLEDCKARAGVTAPIGLVISHRVNSPALLGWIRPRILLPSRLVDCLDEVELRAIFLHELAHFKYFDIPLNWLFIVAQAVHWFNPFVHLSAWAWSRFREEAADASAMSWLSEPDRIHYGTALVHAIKAAHDYEKPFGAMALGESIQQLKRRITMTQSYQNSRPRLAFTTAVALMLSTLIVIQPTRAQSETSLTPEKAAQAAMNLWLEQIDRGQYNESWDDAAASFRQAISNVKWVAALNSVRTPLGKLGQRTFASALHQTEIPDGNKVLKGDYVIAQFETSFANMKFTVETVTFEKESDGNWRASGYYIKPRL